MATSTASTVSETNSARVQCEHGAMLLCSQLVECVQGQDAKLFQSTQVADEARHNEVLQRYLDLRLGGEIYPLGGNVKEIFDTLLGTSSWYLKTIGLQLVAPVRLDQPLERAAR